MPKIVNKLVSTSEAAIALGISKKHLLVLRRQGIFTLGTEYIDISPKSSTKPTYRWEVRKLLRTLANR